MSGKSLLEVKALAKQQAEAQGHSIKRWNRRLLRYTTVCSKCHAELRVYSEAQNEPGLPDSDGSNGVIVARDVEMYWTELDYNIARGSALTEICR